MYKSPIELLITEVTNQIVKEQDEVIFKSVLNYVPNVDRTELLSALQYDRNQYEKGYADGKADAVADLVRCKDCKHWHEGTGWCYHHSHFIDSDGEACHPYESSQWKMMDENDFCSYGERKDNESKL